MDDTNVQLLLLLQRNSRSSWAELAKAVGRSESSVRERVASLESSGLIRGYHAEIDWSRAGLPAHIVVQAQCDLGKIPEIAQRLASIPNVTAAMHMTGDKPILAHLQVRDIEHLRDLLRRHFTDVAFVSPETSIVLQPLVQQRAPNGGMMRPDTLPPELT